MIFYTAKSPIEYQEFFHKQIGLTCTKDEPNHRVWENSSTGMINNYGSVDTIQSGVGNFHVPCDFLVEFQYDIQYLHFGIIFEGITYSMVEDKMVAVSFPSPFLTVKNTTGGINCWRNGQQFRGVEISIEMSYLKNTLLPILGYSAGALHTLEENVHYTNLPDELHTLILRFEEKINSNLMTDALQTAYCLEFLALLLHPKNKTSFLSKEEGFFKTIQVGQRQIRITKDDYEKIKSVHERIRQDASSFLTISNFSHELQISEQKLKAGFQEIYQQTIWDYANSVRMNKAVYLLSKTDQTVSEISRQIGYQSQAAFISMFKKWCGITPGQFRLQLPD